MQPPLEIAWVENQNCVLIDSHGITVAQVFGWDERHLMQTHAEAIVEPVNSHAALTAERDRYKAALEAIADHRPASLESAEGDIARAALEGE